MQVIGIDLAWSPRRLTGLAAGTATSTHVEIIETALARTLEEVEAFVGEHAQGPVTIAIDAPTVVPNAQGMRECERALHLDESIRRAWAAPYPGNRTLLGKCNGGRPRGEELVEALGRRFAVQEAGQPPAGHNGRYVMEVFPSAALVRLFGLTSPLSYKKNGKRTWAACQSGLREYLARLRSLDAPRIAVPTDLHVTNEIGRRFKDIEDRVDAVLCAYVAASAWLGQTEMVGTLADGYIVMPRRLEALPVHS